MDQLKCTNAHDIKTYNIVKNILNVWDSQYQGMTKT